MVEIAEERSHSAALLGARDTPPQGNEIAVFCSPGNSASRGIAQGIGRFGAATRHWRFYSNSMHAARPLPAPRSWRPAALIGNLAGNRRALELADPRLPAVHIEGLTAGAPSDGEPFRRVGPDFKAHGRLAAEHLMGTGFLHFAFAGIGDDPASVGLCDGYGAALHTSNPVLVESFGRGQGGALVEWVSALPKHTGVFAANDTLALALLRAATRAGRSVPSDLAVLGCGNDPLICDFCDGGLSSIRIPWKAIGYQAASRLDVWLREGVALDGFRAPPSHIAARGSTDVLFGSPPLAARAIRFIRAHAVSGIRIQDVLDHLGVSRRSLEMQVRTAIGVSPYEEILRLRVERAKWLLVHTLLPLAEVARRSGFSDSRQMSFTFRRRLDESPSQYRVEHRFSLFSEETYGEDL